MVIYVFHSIRFCRFSVLFYQNLFSCTMVEMHFFLLVFVTKLFLPLGVTPKGHLHCQL